MIRFTVSVVPKWRSNFRDAEPGEAQSILRPVEKAGTIATVGEPHRAACRAVSVKANGGGHGGFQFREHPNKNNAKIRFVTQ